MASVTTGTRVPVITERTWLPGDIDTAIVLGDADVARAIIVVIADTRLTLAVTIQARRPDDTGVTWIAAISIKEIGEHAYATTDEAIGAPTGGPPGHLLAVSVREAGLPPVSIARGLGAIRQSVCGLLIDVAVLRAGVREDEGVFVAAASVEKDKGHEGGDEGRMGQDTNRILRSRRLLRAKRRCRPWRRLSSVRRMHYHVSPRASSPRRVPGTFLGRR